MSPRFLLILLSLAAPLPGLAQSTITLDSFDLGPVDPAPAAEGGEAAAMTNCLAGLGDCDAGLEGGSAFSLDDIVNLGIIDRTEVAAEETGVDPVAPLPSIDLEVFFEYNSATLTPAARSRLDTLADALSDPRIAGGRLVFVGHTDAVGGAAYNVALSQARAEAVAQHVVRVAGFPAERVEATGLGFARLKNPAAPDAAENRRVQVVLIPAAQLAQ